MQFHQYHRASGTSEHFQLICRNEIFIQSCGLYRYELNLLLTLLLVSLKRQPDISPDSGLP